MRAVNECSVTDADRCGKAFAPGRAQNAPVAGVEPRLRLARWRSREYRDPVNALFSWLVVACTDPPQPTPVVHTSASTAKWVLWADESAPVIRPIALFVDAPGGAFDRLADHPDVATFLNDRFHPVFREPTTPETKRAVSFYSADGCLLAGPAQPGDAAAFITLANQVAQLPEAKGRSAESLSFTCARVSSEPPEIPQP